MTSASFETCESLFAAWLEDVRSGSAPIHYTIGSGDINQVEVGPGLLTLLGGAPGAGKTAFAMQAVVDALRSTPSLRALVCNVEMGSRQLLDRQLARISGIDGRDVRQRIRTPASLERMERGLATIGELASRLAFLRPPFTISNVKESVAAYRPHLVLIDYVQRFRPAGESSDPRTSTAAIMGELRTLAATNLAVLAVAAVGRVRSGGQSSYDDSGMNLGSFRESSELEYGADDAYILVREPGVHSGVRLKHLKSRYGEQRDVVLTFDRACQRFSNPLPNPRIDEGRLLAIWEAARPAGEETI